MGDVDVLLSGGWRVVDIECDQCHRRLAMATCSPRTLHWELHSAGGVAGEGQMQLPQAIDNMAPRHFGRIWDSGGPITRSSSDDMGYRPSPGHRTIVCPRGHRSARGRPVRVQASLPYAKLEAACDRVVKEAGQRGRVSLADLR